MRWKFFGQVLLDVISEWPGRRLFPAAVGVVLGLGILTVRLAMAGNWTGAAVSLLFLIAPFLVAAWMWRQSRKAALEEARQARSPLDLS